MKAQTPIGDPDEPDWDDDSDEEDSEEEEEDEDPVQVGRAPGWPGSHSMSSLALDNHL